MADKVYIPGGGDGLQGLKCGPASAAKYDPLETKGSSVKTGDETRTRLTGGLQHQQVTSKNDGQNTHAYYPNKNKPQDG